MDNRGLPQIIPLLEKEKKNNKLHFSFYFFTTQVNIFQAWTYQISERQRFSRFQAAFPHTKRKLKRIGFFRGWVITIHMNSELPKQRLTLDHSLRIVMEVAVPIYNNYFIFSCKI